MCCSIIIALLIIYISKSFVSFFSYSSSVLSWPCFAFTIASILALCFGFLWPYFSQNIPNSLSSAVVVLEPLLSRCNQSNNPSKNLPKSYNPFYGREKNMSHLEQIQLSACSWY